MERGAGGHGPTDGDEPVEGGRPVPGDGREFDAEQADDTDTDTDSVEIVDDGADWLADQLAALPQDTTDIPIVPAAEPDTDESDASEESGESGTDGTDAEGDSGSAADAPPTHRLPVVADDTATPPRGAVSSPEATPVAPEPSLTRPRPVEPVAGWFAPSPPRPPMPVRAEEDGGTTDAADSAESSDTADASGESEASAASGVAGAPDVVSDSVESNVDEDADDDPDLQGADSAESPAAPQPVSSRPFSAHPNAIVIPGLPKRVPAAADESTAADPEPTSADAVEPDVIEPDAIEPEAPERVAPSHAAPVSAVSSSSVPSSAGPSSTPGVPDETGDIDFGSFAWSLVANDEDDPRLVRERREAEERAAAAAEAETARRTAAASAAAAATASAAAAAAATARPSDDTAADDTSADDTAAADTAADDTAATDDAHATEATATDSRTADAVVDESVTPTVITPVAPAPLHGAASASSDDENLRADDAPTWSRPDLDDAFPATAAMDVLPDDDDPDDPDDELDAADRFSALGTAAMPVSAASAAVGEADHVPTPASVGRADASESVFPDGLVSDGEESAPARRSVRSSGETPPAVGSTPSRRSTAGGRSALPLIAAAVVIVLALAGLFYLGTRIPLIFGGSTDAAASASPTPDASAEPTAEQPATGPLAAGTYAWDELQGGECLDPYSSPWAEEFTVVDCAQPHAAQLVFTAPYSDDPAAPFPGADVIASEIGLLCSAPGVVDFAAAAPFTDLQVQGAYPVSGEQWTAGDRDYFCFASRSSGEPLTATVASTP